MVRKVCVITATRAEYGLLLPLLRLLQTDDIFELQLLVSGTHLTAEFGETWRDIEKDGFQIAQKIEMLLASDSPVAVAKSAALAIGGLAPVFSELQPDLLVILGDRYEMLAAALAATLLCIPIAHIHGGEITLGANDEVFRHSITKMSQMHFTSTERYRRRVIQLGELPQQVFNVGALGLDSIRVTKLLTASELAADLGLDLDYPFVVVTYHAETLSQDTANVVDVLLDALLEVPNLQLVCTKANADVGGRAINGRLDEYAGRYPQRVKLFVTLGQLRYLSAMRHSMGVIGNTSSGIIEAPSLQIGSLDIGDRQTGRLRADTVLHSDSSPSSIKRGIAQLLSSHKSLHGNLVANPYGDGHAASRIVSVLSTCDWPLPIKKPFFDIDFKLDRDE